MVHVSFVLAKVVVFGLGLAIVALAFVAARRTRDRLMLYLAIGFLLLTVGSFLEAYLFEFIGWDVFSVHLIESAFAAAGLGIIAWLLRPRARSPEESP